MDAVSSRAASINPQQAGTGRGEAGREGGMMIDSESYLVGEMQACPKCGERRMDYLQWQYFDYGDDSTYEYVKCATCRHEYVPYEPEGI